MDRKKLAVCAIFENAAARLPEWLAYHHVVGVEHFVLYDNGSVDDPGRAVRESPLAEHVTLIRWQQRPGQLAAYRHFIDIFAPGFAWAAFLGVDDFLLPLAGRGVLGSLNFLNTAGAVLVHRRVFSPGPWAEPVPGLAIELHDRRAGDDFPANRHVRVIAHCDDLVDVTTTPNEFRVKGQVFDTAGRLAPNAAVQNLACYQNLVVNHYPLGAPEAWLARIQQDCLAASPAGQGPDGGQVLGGQILEGQVLAALSQVRDDTIQAFAPAVRDLLNLPPREPAPPAVEAAPADAAPRAAGPVVVVSAAPERRSESAMEVAPGWVQRGDDAQERLGGGGLVFRDWSRSGQHWMAALRGAVAGGIDPAFLMDEFDRIQEFPDAAEARAACDAALAAGTGR